MQKQLFFTCILVLVFLFSHTMVCFGNTSLSESIKNGNIKAVKAAFKAGANVNTKDNRERTPLHWAAHKGEIEIVKLLIKAGADLDVKDDNRMVPLHIALRDKHLNIAEALIQAGANIHIKDY